ncbi:hypothetical protein HDU96_010448 [Phlyctochytrium bullatum]|nr:hypothetical protein HDU96_010448 [Phlyctochytrium bullatum]
MPRFCMETMDEAAAAGHFSVVKYLHYHRTEGCTSWAMTKAAKGGFLDILRFLHTNRTEGCRDFALIDAAVNGHFDVVSFLQTELLFFPDIDSRCGLGWEDTNIPTHFIRRLHEDFGWPITESLVTAVMTRGTPEDFRYCLGKAFIPTYDQDGIRRAFRYGKRPWLDNLKILFEAIGKDHQYWEPGNLDCLAKHGHLEMLEFLYENRKERCSRDGLSHAAQFGHADVFNFLTTNDAKALNKIDVKVLNSAVDGGNVEILRILRKLEFPALEGFWNSNLTNHAHTYGRADVVRYLAEELGLPVTLVDFSRSWRAHTFTFDKALFDLEPFHYNCSDPNFSKPLFLEACRFGTFEQVARLSARVPEGRGAFNYAILGDRLDVLQYLHNNRHEEPDPHCLEKAVWQSFEIIKFLIEEVGMRPDLRTMAEAAARGSLNCVKFLYDYLPADVPLDDAISAAITVGEFEIAKFLHMKRRATGQMECKLSNYKTNMDVATFAVENYLSQVHVEVSMGRIKSMFFHQMDVLKYILEGGHLKDQELYEVYDPQLYQLHEIDLDSFQYLLKSGCIHIDDADSLLTPSCLVSFMRALWKICPERFTMFPSRSAVCRCYDI